MKTIFQKIITFNVLLAYAPFTIAAPSWSSFSSWLFNTTQKTYNTTFQASPTTTLALDNLHGSVTVRTWAEPKVALDAVTSGKEKEIADVVIHAQEADGQITIRTEQTTETKNKSTVEYTVMVPVEMPVTITTQSGNISADGTQGPLTATTHSGNIAATQARGSVQAHTDSGSITMAYSYLPPESIVQATSDNGAIALALPPATHAHVAAKTEKGSITTQQTVLLKPQLTQLGRSAWKQFRQQAFFTLGEGGATISLFTKNGTIKTTEL
jgi:DUF4097 and DUF4098 domain-containing protein YvlB